MKKVHSSPLDLDGFAYGPASKKFKPNPAQGSEEGAVGGADAKVPAFPEESDPLKLKPLFDGGGEAWYPLLKRTIENQAGSEQFIGPDRDKGVVPVRELTFQALKPNPPERWSVVVFGQNPYPRVESATGIAMFDNTFHTWQDKRFGAVTSMRCIVKAAMIWKLGIEKRTPVSRLRQLLKQHAVVPPPDWFKAVLSQGCLLLNAALTASSSGSVRTSAHTKFWRPIIRKIIEEILSAKARTADAACRGIVFAWWGSKAKQVRKVVKDIVSKFKNSVPVRHIDHCNPAAMGDKFCEGNPFQKINKALEELKMRPIDWLPSTGWRSDHGVSAGDAKRVSQFVDNTMKLHKSYLERLSDARSEQLVELPSITGVMSLPERDLLTCCDRIGRGDLVPALPLFAANAIKFAKNIGYSSLPDSMSVNEAAALHLYTVENGLYQELNQSLRDPERRHTHLFFPFLRLFVGALRKLPRFTGALYRGVDLNLEHKYKKGSTVVWWGISSCTRDIDVAERFLGPSGPRTLFHLSPRSAVSIRAFSAFQAEDEFLIAPGVQFYVADVQRKGQGLVIIHLDELSLPAKLS